MIPTPAHHAKPTHLIPVLLLVLFAVLLINCGDGSADSTEPPAPGQDSTNTPTAPPDSTRPATPTPRQDSTDTPTGATGSYDLQAVREYAEACDRVSAAAGSISIDEQSPWETLLDPLESLLDGLKGLQPPPVLREYHESAIVWNEDFLALVKSQDGSELVSLSFLEGEPSDSLTLLLSVRDGLPAEVQEILNAHDC